MIRTAGIVAALALLAVSAVSAIAGSRSRQAMEPRCLGSGVFLSIDECHVERARGGDGLIETHVTLSNHGAKPLKIDYLTFSLSGSGNERFLALLPSELQGRVASPLLLREGILAAGQRLVAVLYFRPPSSNSRPIDFRVDLVRPDDRTASRSFLPLALD